MAKVVIDGLTDVQANCLAILFEGFAIVDFINEEFKQKDFDVLGLYPYPDIDFDTAVIGTQHEVTFHPSLL